MTVDRVTDRSHDPAGGNMTISQRCGKGTVLTDRQELAVQVTGAEPGRDITGLRLLAVQSGNRQVGSDVHPVAGDDRGLAAVHGPDGRGDRGRRFRLPDECELDVQHDPDGPAGDRGSGSVRADTAGGPHRPVQVVGREQVLEQGERCQVAHPATRLVPSGDQAVGAGRDRGPGFGNRDDLHEDAAATIH